MGDEQDEHEGPLAEFVALRQEIERRNLVQHALFVFQLTASGAIISFALAGSGHTEFLLIIPISTYMLCARYVEQQYGIQRVARYIKDELSPRIPGGLGWETWQLANSRFVRGSTIRRINALMIMFPAIGLCAVVWTTGTVFGNVLRLNAAQRVGVVSVWLLGVAAIVMSVQMIWTMVRHPLGDMVLPPLYPLPSVDPGNTAETPSVDNGGGA
jgi:hypothetical protein